MAEYTPGEETNPAGTIFFASISDVPAWTNQDLNSKFVLQVYRDYALSHDVSILQFCWPAMKACAFCCFSYR